MSRPVTIRHYAALPELLALPRALVVPIVDWSGDAQRWSARLHRLASQAPFWRGSAPPITFVILEYEGERKLEEWWWQWATAQRARVDLEPRGGRGKAFCMVHGVVVAAGFLDTWGALVARAFGP